MSFSRRQLLKASLVSYATAIGNPDIVWADEDIPKPNSNRFLLYIHFDSSCGVASGLVQPIKKGVWPLGFNVAGSAEGSTNPLLNIHTQEGNLIFHDYNKFLASIAQHLCLVSGNSQSLDHGAAFNLQTRGNQIAISAPEWPQAVTQFMRTEKNKNPMIISSGAKTSSTPDITSVSANSLGDFQLITRDANVVPSFKNDPILNRLKARFGKSSLGSVLLESGLQGTASYQLNTLTQGLKELADAADEVKSLEQKISESEVKKLLAGSAEKDLLLKEAGFGFGVPENPLRKKLILAGVLAKTGIANGMTISLYRGIEDTHTGGAEVGTARRASANWALIHSFWQWVVAAGLQDDVMVVCGHDFTRSAYNSYRSVKMNITNAAGQNQEVVCPGRDHSLAMGYLFLNGKVPPAGRVGIVGDNLAAMATKDAKGTPDTEGVPYTSDAIIGSMLMRVWPEIFPSERMVRKHWPSFREVAPLLK